MRDLMQTLGVLDEERPTQQCIDIPAKHNSHLKDTPSILALSVTLEQTHCV
jgi:hypothetical protein